jgi:cytochrome c oxidase assembly protein subunit 15
MIYPLLILFLLGALQGAIGWIMVASGLTGDAVYVKPTKLATHFVFALGLICYAFWYALQLRIPSTERVYNRSLHKQAWWITGILFLQLGFGALMAGHKAATAAPTWPTINGEWIPGSLFRDNPVLLNFIDNPVTIHFVHRGLAYLLLIMIIIYSARAFRVTPGTGVFAKARRWPLIFVLLQVLLGILSVYTSIGIIPNRWGTFEWMAQLHQITAMLLLLSLIALLYLTRRASFVQPS